MVRSVAVVFAAALCVACQAYEYEFPRTEQHRAAISAYCTAQVTGSGQVDVENDYLPNVIRCENGAASMEALKAQAVAARSFLYYKLDGQGYINDGTGDQVYSCGGSPGADHYAAVAATAGQVLRYNGVTICSFYVAGAIPSAADCVAVPGDNDYSGTEHYVTYNWGLSGSNINQSSIGWVNPGNYYNRGCKSQNGADCLSDAGWNYQDILKFYYGMDITIETAVGSCVAPTECTAGDTESEGCGNCGTRSRTCDAAGTWGAWSTCTGEGECVPDTTQTENCGECGQWTRTCDSSCSWGAWGSCESVPTNEPCTTGEVGLCGEGVYECVAAQLVCVPTLQSRPELCDGLDDNCDGLVDEGFPQVLGDPPPVYAARLSIVDVPNQLNPGVPGDIRLRVENVGTASWVAGDVELNAIANGGAPSQLYSPSWSSSQVILQVGDLGAGQSDTLQFEITVSGDATGTINEAFWLTRTDMAPINCPSPSVNITVTSSGEINTTVPDAGPDTEPLPSISTGCRCQTGGSPAGLLWLLPVLLWVWRRRRGR